MHLTEEEARLVAESRSKTGEITSAANMIKIHLPEGMTLEQFNMLAVISDIDNKITEQERRLEGVWHGSQIQAQPEISMIALPDPV